ncbi:proton-coupled zinc antiporter SLC30A2-like [Ascaphus truei]|uniref:proton-coupled zinc antiporter SLC30A2-like n=1 Tax=Ascaphus truei TaxID=8439 RepID=UPI003F599A6F
MDNELPMETYWGGGGGLAVCRDGDVCVGTPLLRAPHSASLSAGTPKGVDFNLVKDTLLSISGVKALHSLHIWALTVSQPVLSVHIAINEDGNAQLVLKEASSRLQNKFHFHTTTIQIENYSEDMRDCHECQDPTD